MGNPCGDYALAYDPVSGRLHFGAECRDGLDFGVMVYDSRGRRIGSFRASDDFSLLPYPAGLYIVTWRYQGRQQSVKFMK